MFIPIIFIIAYLISNQIKYPEVRWNWDEIDVTKLDFPLGFEWGVATAAHQVEGNSINNWSRWEEGSFENGRPHIHKEEKSGIACDHWNKYKEDIIVCKELGVDVEGDFTPSYEVSQDKKAIVKNLRDLAKKSVMRY